MNRQIQSHLRVAGLRNERGAVLGVVLIVLLIFSILGFELIALSGRDGVETGRSVILQQAFWAADAGVQHARAMLRRSAVFRAAPWVLTGTGINYSASTVAFPAGVYQVTSTGTKQTAVRVVQQILSVTESWPAAFDYILFGGGGSMSIRQDASVVGDIFQYGDIDFSSLTMTGTVYATGTVSGYPRTDPPDPPPDMPALNTTYYDTLIAYARTNGGGGRTYPLSLNGATLYVKDSESLGNITGPGTLVVGGGASFSKDLVFGSNVQVIAGGTFSIDKNLEAGSNCFLYATAGFEIAKSVDVSIGNCVLITPGYIDAKKSLTMSGIMYAGGTITMNKDLILTGSAVSGDGFTIFKTATLIYDRSRFPPILPPGLDPEIRVVNILWKEQI